MVNSWQEVTDKLNDRGNVKDALLDLISRADNMPAMLKVLAVGSLANMQEQRVNALADLLLECVEFLKAEDMDGLKEYLKTCHIPPQIVAMVETYARAYTNKLKP